MPNDPSVTRPNLVITQLSVRSGCVLGGEGRVGVEWWHENHFHDQIPRLPHPPWAAALLLRIQGTGLAFPSFHPNQAAQPEVKEQGPHHRSSIFETEKWGKFKTSFHS